MKKFSIVMMGLAMSAPVFLGKVWAGGVDGGERVPEMVSYQRVSPSLGAAYRGMTQAFAAGDVARVRQMVAEGASVDLALFCAAAAHRKDAVQEFLAAGAQVNSRPFERCSPLYAAIGKRRLERHDGWASASLETEPYEGQVELVRVLLAAGADPNLASSYDVLTPLMEAVRGGDGATVRLLLESGAKVNMRDGHGLSALHYAVLSGRLEMMQMLLSAGARTDLLSVNRQHYGHLDIPLKSSLLHLAALMNNVEALRLLLSYQADKEAEDMHGNTPFLNAARANSLLCMQALAEAGTDVKHENRMKKNAISCLNYVDAEERLQPAMQYLLGLGIPTQAWALTYAAAAKNVPAMCCLIEAGARPTGLKDEDSPLLMLLSTYHSSAVKLNEPAVKEAIQLLVTAGLELRYERLSLMLAVREGKDEIFHFLRCLGVPVTSEVEDIQEILRLASQGWEAYPGRERIFRWLVTEGGMAEEYERSQAEERKRQANAMMTRAVRAGDVEGMQRALQEGADVNYQDGSLPNHLEVAVRLEKLEVLEWLLQHGGNPNVSTYSESLLMAALRQRKEKSVRLLLRYGADINAPGSCGETFLHMATAQHQLNFMRIALENGASLLDKTCDGQHVLMFVRSREQAELLLSRAPELLQMVDAAGNTVLHHAAAKCSSSPAKWVEVMCLQGGADGKNVKSVKSSCPEAPELVGYLLQRGLDPNARNAKGETPLMVAARQVSVKACRMLLEAGADARLCDHTGRSALSYALGSDNAELVELLRLSGVPEPKEQVFLQAVAAGDADAVNRLAGTVVLRDEPGGIGYVAMKTAVFAGHEDIARLLMNRGVNINMVNDAELSLLHLSVQENRPEAIRLLARLGAKLNEYRAFGFASTGTALHMAIQQGKLSLVKLLHELGASLKVGRQSPFKYALAGEHADIIRWLVEQGEPVDALMGMQRTPLTEAVYRQQAKMAKLLLELGANPDGVGYHHETPLRWAIQNRDVELVRMLLEAGATADHTDNYNRHHLYAAAVACPAEIIGMLIKAGAKVDRICKDPNHNSSALINVCYFQNGDRAEAVKLLLEAGADPFIKDAKGKTALDYAKANGFTQSAAILEAAVKSNDSK